MTNILIGDIVRTRIGQDMVIGFMPNDKVMLVSGSISDIEPLEVIGYYDSIKDQFILHSDLPVDMDVIRRCGGFREYANEVVIGPIL